MDADKLAIDLLLKGMTQDQQTAALESIKESVAQAKAIQKQRIGENVQVVVQALKKLEADIRDRYDEVGNKIEKRVATIKDGKDGRNGVNGKDGKDGRPGRDGGQGPRGTDGLNGSNGRDGEDGVSVTDAHIDFDGSLVISLSSGRTLNVGEVVAPDLAEKIKVITNGGGTSQSVLDTLASLQTQIDNLQGGGDVVGPAASTDGSLAAFDGTTGKLIKQAAVVTVAQGGTGTATPSLVQGTNVTITGTWPNQTINASGGGGGGGTVTSVDVSGGTTGLTTSGGPVTTTGTITLSGTLAIANGGTGQTTAAAAITALTGTQTSGQYLRSDGTNSVLSAIQAGDVPTLNQNTTGTAANVTGTVAVANGGTGTATPALVAGTNVTITGAWPNQTINSSGSGGGLTYVYTTTPVTATNNQGVLTDTSGGAFTVTLPATPTTGAQVVVADAGANWGVNNLTVGRNGSTIGGLAQDLVCDLSGVSVQFVYDGTTWEVYAQVGGQGGNAVTLTGVQTLTNKTLTSPTITSAALITASAGLLEYDGKVPYFTPQGLQRGVVPGMQYYRLNSALAGANSTADQSIFGVGVTLSSGTVYAFQAFFSISKTAGTTGHTLSYGFGGTATNTNFINNIQRFGLAQALPFTAVSASAFTWQVRTSTALTAATGSVTTAAFTDVIIVEGTISVDVGGTFIPQYKLSAAPGGAYSTNTNSWFAIYPIGATGSNTSVGTWA